LAEENRKSSASNRTGHMNIRYYLVVDCWASCEVIVKISPTQQNIVGLFSKLTQKSLSNASRAIILNKDSESQYSNYHHYRRNKKKAEYANDQINPNSTCMFDSPKPKIDQKLACAVSNPW